MHRRWSLAAMLALLLAGPVTPVLAQESGFPLPALEVITPENANQIEQVSQLREREHDLDQVWDIAFSPDGRALAYAGLYELVLWDLISGEQLFELAGNYAYGGQLVLAFSPNSKLLASAGEDVYLWDVATGKLQTTLGEYFREVTSIEFSPDGRILASGGGRDDGEVRLYSVDPVSEAATEDPYVVLGWVGYEASSLAFNPDGTRLASGSWSGRVMLWRVIYPDEEVANDFWPYREIYELNWLARVMSVAWSPDGETLVCGNSDGLIWRWNAVSPWQTLRVLGRHNESVSSLAFSPDGMLLASGSGDWQKDMGTVRIWDVATGELLAEPENIDSEIASVAFNPDGTLLAFGGADGAVRLYGIPAGN